MERSAWPKNLSSSRKRAIQDLFYGQNPKKKLADLFDAHSQTGNNTGQLLIAEHLVVNVLGSFSNALSLSSSAESDEVLQVPSNAYVGSEVSERSESINSPLPSETSDVWWTIRLIHDLDDRYQWRIVDQGPIPKFAGKYYKCAHQIDQGCQATKLVDRTSHDPRLFLITYRGRHTCNNLTLTDLPLPTAATGTDQATVDGGFSSDIEDKRAKNSADLLAELQRMGVENQRLREMLSQVTNNYTALQLHLSSLLQQQQQQHWNNGVGRKSAEDDLLISDV